jgi:DNA-binding PadR family transcriptional regulator
MTESATPSATAGGELSASAWAVLGLLSFPGERTGYEIKAWADRSVRFFYWSPALSHVYRELRRLESVGYVTSRVEAHDDIRNKRLYRITEAGTAALTEWARTSPDAPPVLKHPVILRVWLGRLVGTEDLTRIIDDHIAWAEEMIAEVRNRESQAAVDDDWAYPRLALRWSERYFAAERDLAKAMLADVAELANGSITPRQARSG